MTEKNIVEIRGYSNVFAQPVWHFGQRMSFAPGAFSAWLSEAPRHVPILWELHDGPAISSTAFMFEDEYGLAFSAELDTQADGQNWNRIATMTKRRDPVAQCSGTFIIRDSVRDGDETIITDAELDHIALVREGAWRSTAVWPADFEGAAPWKVVSLAARWEAGSLARAHRICEAAKQTVARWEAYQAHKG